VPFRSIKQAVAHISEFPPKKLNRLLGRILDKLHLPDEKPFTDAEEAQLTLALAVPEDALRLVLETLAFLFETVRPRVPHPPGTVPIAPCPLGRAACPLPSIHAWPAVCPSSTSPRAGHPPLFANDNLAHAYLSAQSCAFAGA